MALEISFANDVTNAIERARGSDGRMNVSARTDSRAYYNSRDEQSMYTVEWEDDTSATGDFVLYWKNTATDGRHLVIVKIECWSDNIAHWILHQGDNVAATGGKSVTPKNLNLANSQTAPATARTADTSTIAGVGASSLIAHSGAPLQGPAIFQFGDTLRLGQEQNILLEMQLATGSPDLTYGTAYGYYE